MSSAWRLIVCASDQCLCCSQISPQMRDLLKRERFHLNQIRFTIAGKSSSPGSLPTRNGEGRGQSVFEQTSIMQRSIVRVICFCFGCSFCSRDQTVREVCFLVGEKMQSNFGARNNDSNKWRPENQSQRNQLQDARALFVFENRKCWSNSELHVKNCVLKSSFSGKSLDFEPLKPNIEC